MLTPVQSEGFQPLKLLFLPLFIFVIFAAIYITGAGLASLSDGYDALVEVGVPVAHDMISLITGFLDSIPHMGAALGVVGESIAFGYSLLPSIEIPTGVIIVAKIMGAMGLCSFIGMAFFLGLEAASDPESYPN
ncbi:hypothetical protein [Mesorhizobium sp. A623]